MALYLISPEGSKILLQILIINVTLCVDSVMFELCV